jgi:WD40 repeat protein/serine/threonine protein kinase
MPIPEIELIVSQDGTELLRKTVRPGDYVIGREADCDVQLDVDLVSRRHAQLTVNFDHVLIEDLGSSNGTFVNDKLVAGPVRLWPNQKITIGAATIVLRRVKTESGIDDSLSPHLAVMHKALPEEFLRDKKYDIGGIVAQGGMGAILDAREATTERTVAMKVMLDSTSPQGMTRFIAEAKITAQLEHPNIVPVHELSVDENDQVFYTMKFVKGVTLREVLTKLCNGDAETLEKYPLAALLIVFQKVCDALAFGHSKGVIHRDLKPENVMLGDYGEVLVMDWGLAKVLSETETAKAGVNVTSRIASPPSEFVTMAGAVMGTPQYMSPEQARGEVDLLDQRTDIYALGAILYHMLTLRPSVTGRSVLEILEKVAYGRIVWPAHAASTISGSRHPENEAQQAGVGTPRLQHLPGGGVPDSLDAVCRKAMALEPPARYQHVTELQRDIAAYQGGFATVAEGAGAWKLFRFFIERNKAVSISVVAGLVLSAAIAALFTMRVVVERNRAVASEKRANDALAAVEEERNRAETERTRAENERARAEKALADIVGERKRADEAGAQADSEKKRAEKAAIDAEAERAKTVEANTESLRRQQDASMADYALAVRRIDKDNSWDEGVALLARGLDHDPKNMLAAMRLYGTIALAAPCKASLLRSVLAHEGPVESASFSPDGKRIVTACADRTVRLWDAATGKPLGDPIRSRYPAMSAMFSPDGTRILINTPNMTALLWNVAAGRLMGDPMIHSGQILHASFSPDGRRILTASSDKTARIWDAFTGKPLGEPLPHQEMVESASFSPDGSRIATVTFGGFVRVWDAAKGSIISGPVQHSSSAYSASFSPDGTRIVTASEDKTARIWDAATARTIGEPMWHEKAVRSACFSPDGTRIVTASDDGTARLWDGASGKAVGEPMRHERTVRGASFSPDGARILTRSDDGTARLWDGATAKPLGQPMRHGGSMVSASFSPDGTQILTASSDKTARLWEAVSDGSPGEPMRHEATVNDASFSPDGARIVTASEDKTARLWLTATGAAIGEPMRHEFSVGSASFNPAGTWIVTAGADKAARVWDATTGSALREPIRHNAPVLRASFSPDGKHILTLSADNCARLWDAATGRTLGDPMRHEDQVHSASFSPDGARIVTASKDKTARLWDGATGAPLGDVMRHRGDVHHAIFSPDGARIITVSDDFVSVPPLSPLQLWDGVTGKPLGEPMRHGYGVRTVSFSPDGARILTLGGGAGVWEVTGGRQIGERIRHEGVVFSASFSPDGARIVTTGSDQIARLWNAATCTPIGEPMRDEGKFYDARFSPDGTRILTKGTQIVRLWNLGSMLRLPEVTPGWVTDWARAIAGQGLNPEGAIKNISGEERIKMRYAPHEGDDPWSRLARWLATDPRKRTVSPDSTQTARQIAERERDFASKESVGAALRYDSTVPLAHLMLAKFESDSQRAGFLRDYDLKRLPDEPLLWERALRSLYDQKDETRVRQALQKLEQLAPGRAGALRRELTL